MINLCRLFSLQARMFALRCSVFLLLLLTAYALVPPFYGYRKENDEAEDAQGQTCILERRPRNRRLLPLTLADEYGEFTASAGTKQTASSTTIDFKSLKEQNEHIVDKSNFIIDFLNDEYTNVVITRPRGFGKSFTYSMIYHFLNINDNSTDLFKGTSVANNRDVCLTHQNQYPVIRVSFEELANAKTWEEAESLLLKAFRKMLDDHSHLVDIKTVSGTKQEVQWNLDLTYMIRRLSEQLHGVLKKKSIVLIDGYDTPIRTAFFHGYYDKMMKLFRPFYLSVLKDNPFLHKSLILGESGIGKVDIFSEVVHLASYTVLESRYSSYFGFSKTETVRLIQYYKLNTRVSVNMVRKYGGYLFGDRYLLNPYSVAQCLKNNGKLYNYWQSPMRDLVKLMISSGIVPLFESEVLLMRRLINHTYDTLLAYPSIKKDLDAFWTLVTDSGYVTITEKQQELLGKYKCRLAIPNEDAFDEIGRFVDEFYAKHKNIVTPKELMKIMQSQNISRSLDCFKSYFDNALQYFAAEKVNDPLSQMEILARNLIEVQRMYYRTNRILAGNNSFSITIKGVPFNFWLLFVVNANKVEHTCVKLISGFFFEYGRLFGKVRYGSTVLDDKYLIYLVTDSKGNRLQQTINFIDHWVGRPVENMATKLRTCLKNWFHSDI